MISSSICLVVTAIENASLKLYGVQFHPEVDLTCSGTTMLRNFLFGVVGLTGSYKLKSREESCIKYIREAVKDQKVLVCRTHCSLLLAVNS